VQLAVFTASQGTHPFHRFIAALQKLADFFQKEFFLGGKGYAARAAAQKIHPDLILQVLDLAAQGRLRDSKTVVNNRVHMPKWQKAHESIKSDLC